MSRSALALLSVLCLAGPASAFIIDDFESGDFVVVDSITTGGFETAEQSGLANSSVRGGVRLVSANSTTLTGVTATASLTTAPLVDDALLLTAVNAGGQFNLFYDGIANGNFDGTGGNLNLDLSAKTHLEIQAEAGDSGVFLRAWLYSSTGNKFSPLLQVKEDGTPLIIGMSVFAGLDLTDIQAIRFFITGVSTTAPVTIAQISAEPIPEPGTALLLGLGLAGVAARRRGRRA